MSAKIVVWAPRSLRIRVGNFAALPAMDVSTMPLFLHVPIRWLTVTLILTPKLIGPRREFMRACVRSLTNGVLA